MKKMKVIKKFQRNGSINPITIEDYLNYWRDNNVETNEALLQRLATKYSSPENMKAIIEGNETNRQAENIREALLKLGIATGVVAVGQQ